MNENDSGLSRYMRDIGRFPLLTVQQETELAEKIKKNDAEARERMINSNLRLVVTIAHDYANLGLPLLDLISEGNVGLTKAVERFDPAKGAKLSTYAMWWIKQSIKRALANQSKTIRLPVHLVDKIARVRRASRQMSDELGREATDDELGEEIGIASEKIARLKNLGIHTTSIDSPIGDDDATEVGEVIGDEAAQTPFEMLRHKNLLREIGGLLDMLDKREMTIISQRFGLDGGEPETLENVAKNFGITRERIRQLQNIALAKLRCAFRKRRGSVGRGAEPCLTDREETLLHCVSQRKADTRRQRCSDCSTPVRKTLTRPPSRTRRGLLFYQEGEFRDAERLFRTLSGFDKPSSVLDKRCADLAAHPPENWCGVFVFAPK